MKKHPEIKWSEIARRAIEEYLQELESSKAEISMDEFRGLLGGEETLKEIEATHNEAYEGYYKKVRELEWDRTKRSSTTRTS
ncbi:hypothetical protein [Thermococcus peptonophilus]|uniref:hypothetical protein n=1 Tax=Thermococcus peptonophilus TaxID=53952 RepID=UPI000A4A7CED